MNADQIKEAMLANAVEINRLNEKIHETVRHRDKSPKQRDEWKKACAEFGARYDALAFPGGYSKEMLDRIKAGDKTAVESAICFLECRPYFFRSGYMFKDILRKVKQAPLSSEHAERLRMVMDRLAEWRRRKAAA